jgi:predicted MPP superfamily phosphohydrolase
MTSLLCFDDSNPLDQGLSEPRIETIRKGRWLQIGAPSGLEWTRVHLPVPGLSAKLIGFRIIQLTDMHLTSRWWRVYEELHRCVNENPPDLLLCTGDFVEYKWSRQRTLPILERFINGFTSRLGFWGILGNHDGDLLLPHLMTYRLNMINNQRTIIETGTDPIELIGLPSANRLDLDDDFLRSMPARQPGLLRILLQHYPDQISRTKQLEPDMIFAGHTHGGQICLPGGRAIISHDSLPKQFASGVHRLESTWLIVSRGLGFATMPVRTFCSPQVMEVVLAAKKG